MNFFYKYFWWIVLNIQLVIGIAYSYDYFHRHIIVNYVLFFMIILVILANIFFKITNFIKIKSLRSYLSIIISAFIVGVAAIKNNNSMASFDYMSFSLLFLYINLRLLVFITTPIVILIEIVLHYCNKKLGQY